VLVGSPVIVEPDEIWRWEVVCRSNFTADIGGLGSGDSTLSPPIVEVFVIVRESLRDGGVRNSSSESGITSSSPVGIIGNGSDGAGSGDLVFPELAGAFKRFDEPSRS
jgi:hypothetical protein